MSKKKNVAEIKDQPIDPTAIKPLAPLSEEERRILLRRAQELQKSEDLGRQERLEKIKALVREGRYEEPQVEQVAAALESYLSGEIDNEKVQFKKDPGKKE